MKIAVIGSTGMVGATAVAEAVARGHEVSAYNRTGSPVDGAHSAALDLTDTAAVVDVINEHDVTIITAVIRDRQGEGYEAIKKAHRDLVAAAPTGRFITVGGAGALSLPDGTELRNLPDFPADYKLEADSFAEILGYYTGSELSAWSILAPAPEIAPGVRTGAYLTELDTPAGDFVSAEDFALALIDEAENNAHAGQRFTVASADAVAAQG